MIKERFPVNYQQLGDEELIAELVQRFETKRIVSDEWWITERHRKKQYNSKNKEDENKLVTERIEILIDRIASGTYIILNFSVYFSFILY